MKLEKVTEERIERARRQEGSLTGCFHHSHSSQTHMDTGILPSESLGWYTDYGIYLGEMFFETRTITLVLR